MIRVFLVDDHPVVRAGLRSILESFPDITVVGEADDGAGLGAVDADVVVCDLSMPGVDGVTATANIRAAGGPPVLILTTFNTQADIMNALEAGALGYLLKDAPAHELHAAVQATSRGQRTLSPEVAIALAERVSRPFEALSRRETEILQALAEGLSNRELAQRFFVSEATIKTHLIHIYRKLRVDNRTAAVTRAQENKLI